MRVVSRCLILLNGSARKRMLFDFTVKIRNSCILQVFSKVDCLFAKKKMSSRFRKAGLLQMRRGIKKGVDVARALSKQRMLMMARRTGWVVRRNRSVSQRSAGVYGPSGDAKFVDVASTTYNMDTTGTITHISIVPQGSTVNSREGRSFRVTSLMVRGNVYPGASTSLTQGTLLFVWDKQPNKALAAITDVLESANSQAQNKRENASRFVIIRRFDYDVVGNTGAAANLTDKSQHLVQEYIKFPRDCVATCTATDTTGAIGNRVTGALLMVTVGVNVAGATAATFCGNMRVNIQDV